MMQYIDYILLVPLMLLALTCFIIGMMKLGILIVERRKKNEYHTDAIVDEIPAKNVAQLNNIDLLFQLICKYDDGVIMDALEEAFVPLMVMEDGLDVVVLNISRNFGKIKDAEHARAAVITKRLAHILYRQYRKLNPDYSSPDFLQVV